jgi:hypothetical protein
MNSALVGEANRAWWLEGLTEHRFLSILPHNSVPAEAPGRAILWSLRLVIGLSRRVF